MPTPAPEGFEAEIITFEPNKYALCLLHGLEHASREDWRQLIASIEVPKSFWLKLLSNEDRLNPYLTLGADSDTFEGIPIVQSEISQPTLVLFNGNRKTLSFDFGWN